VLANVNTAQRFGQTLRTLRMSAELSLRELARRVGVTPGYLSQVECGHLAPPTKNRLQKIAGVLGVSSHDFLRMSGRLDPVLLHYLVENPQSQELLKTIQELDLNTRQLVRLTGALRENSKALFGHENLKSQRPQLLSSLRPSLLFCQLKKRTRNTLLSFLLDAIEANLSPDESAHFDRERALKALLARERKASTVVGEGVALPHARVEGLQTVHIALAVLAHRVNFGQLSDEKVRIVALILTPKSESNEHVQVLVEIATLLNQEEIRKDLLMTRSGPEMFDLLGACLL
jgi:mannitol/fructose-specific phosphotransferase system IIA component (Ntr-type)